MKEGGGSDSDGWGDEGVQEKWRRKECVTGRKRKGRRVKEGDMEMGGGGGGERSEGRVYGGGWFRE